MPPSLRPLAASIDRGTGRHPRPLLQCRPRGCDGSTAAPGDAETVNRFAQMVFGEAEHRKQLHWLHSGPFRGTESPSQNVVALRFLRPDVALVHTL